METSTVKVKSEDEMISQLKILLSNGYAVAICQEDNMGLPDTTEYTIAYKKRGVS